MIQRDIDRIIISHYIHSMAFIRRKAVKKYVYHQLVENYRDGKKVKQRVLKHIGNKRPSDAELQRLIEEVRK